MSTVRPTKAYKTRRANEAKRAKPAPVTPPRIEWTTCKLALKTLTPWERNPRRISEPASKRLLDSFDSFGQVDTLAIGPNNEVYNGHQRLKVLVEKFGPDYEVDARRASRALSEKEREKLTIYLHRGATGEFDLEALAASFDIAELDSWGMPDLNVPDIPEEQWAAGGMPEHDGLPREHAKVTVRFMNEQDIAAFAELIGQAVTADTVSIWFPAKSREDERAKKWVASEP